jgi:hypothetical protein
MERKKARGIELSRQIGGNNFKTVNSQREKKEKLIIVYTLSLSLHINIP